MEQHQYSLADLLTIMAALRDPESGCPWDLKQDFASIVPHTLEEAYEVADTIARQAWEELPGELGDLLFQVVFYARLGEEQARFNFADVVQAVSEKLVSRHPHVFGQARFDDEAAIKANWEATKAAERKERDASATSALDDIPLALPALTRAHKMQKRCAAVGFDWRELPPVVDKIREELDEVMEEVNRPEHDADRIADELGDLLFATVNLVRHLKQEPESVLRRANDKFERRFRGVEQLLAADGRSSRDCSLEELDGYWNRVKRGEA
ncbi:nucleoside triphosphate pyrophosphohydrolase [Oceanimonas sp. NS1]|uniref:Nucleoside triphosphate pyrophosphohydrolase n=1 Tax=Oceanimonas doudoroffii TaxID=84158 RepID=A0A233RCJ5_9GAMM|nr:MULTISPECIES: nucleoside triphosphate pyrophosphohydrolase [Oceanimonas]MCT7654961.1 nucleoside triphosphate pyrophosphohydrolase [Oceanimonas sp. NS1]NHI00933.1 Nucleoside triphosphate pyrophosphohydrolase [Oceanimonas sp. MB9]OXY81102.1 nucleoside triphosphate pyrophosphohydrolase [Oceanimonas doudoroffii]